MEHALQLAEIGFVSGLGPMGFGEDTPIETEDGPCRAGDIRPGQKVRRSDGKLCKVVSVTHCDPTDRWVSLPAKGSDARLIVAANQPLICRHFLCAALFGATEAVLRTGDLVGSQVKPSDGAWHRLVQLTLEGAETVTLGGYEFLCDWSFDAGAEAAGRPQGGTAGSRSRAVVGPQETRQIRDAGILFRKGNQG
jgi:hypothetical protein